MNIDFHNHQAKKYKEEGMKPIGFIKFNNHFDDLAKGNIYLPTIESFNKQGKSGIKDKFEGNAVTKDGDLINYKDLISAYEKYHSGENGHVYVQSYISSFTTIFDSDFDSNGVIKKKVFNRILRRNGKCSDTENRSAVTFSNSFNGFIVSSMSLFSSLHLIYSNAHTGVKFSYVDYDDPKKFIINKTRSDLKNGNFSFRTLEFDYLPKCFLLKGSCYKNQREFRVIVTKISRKVLGNHFYLRNYLNIPIDTNIISRHDIKNNGRKALLLSYFRTFA